MPVPQSVETIEDKWQPIGWWPFGECPNVLEFVSPLTVSFIGGNRYWVWEFWCGSYSVNIYYLVDDANRRLIWKKGKPPIRSKSCLV